MADERDDGIRCRNPRCGCRDLRVYETRALPQQRILRIRVCRNCGLKLYTTEQVAGIVTARPGRKQARNARKSQSQ